MTSGKSTIGSILANVYGWKFFDLDQIIEDKEKKTVVEIFESLGEEKFRDLEKDTLSKICQKENCIVSLGGGTVENKGILELLRNSGYVVYLKVSPENLYHRLKKKIDRPLFRDLVLSEGSKEEFLKRIDKLLSKREPVYEKADIVIDTDNTKIGITVDLIAKKIEKLLNEKK